MSDMEKKIRRCINHKVFQEYVDQGLYSSAAAFAVGYIGGEDFDHPKYPELIAMIRAIGGVKF